MLTGAALYFTYKAGLNDLDDSGTGLIVLALGWPPALWALATGDLNPQRAEMVRDTVRKNLLELTVELRGGGGALGHRRAASQRSPAAVNPRAGRAGSWLGCVPLVLLQESAESIQVVLLTCRPRDHTGGERAGAHVVDLAASLLQQDQGSVGGSTESIAVRRESGSAPKRRGCAAGHR